MNSGVEEIGEVKGVLGEHLFVRGLELEGRSQLLLLLQPGHKEHEFLFLIT